VRRALRIFPLYYGVLGAYLGRPIYLKAYDRKTLLAVIRFYDTEEGKNVIAGLPHVMSEAMAVGQKWGRELADKSLAASRPPENPAAPPSAQP